MVLLIEPGTLVCTNSSAEGGFAGRMLETHRCSFIAPIRVGKQAVKKQRTTACRREKANSRVFEEGYMF